VVGWVHDRAGSPTEDQAGSGQLLGTLTGMLGPNGALTAQIGTGTPVPVGAANIQKGGCGWKSKRR
jgi:hypothetical protein